MASVFDDETLDWCQTTSRTEVKVRDPLLLRFAPGLPFRCDGVVDCSQVRSMSSTTVSRYDARSYCASTMLSRGTGRPTQSYISRIVHPTVKLEA